MAEQPLASEEEVEQARDTLAEEALVAFFAVQMLMDGDEGDGADLTMAIEQWATRGARRLWNLYAAGAAALGATFEQAGQELRTTFAPQDFTPSRATMTELTRAVKAMRRTLRSDQRAVQRGEALGPHLTPEVAANAAANEAHGLLSMDMAEALGDDAMPGLKIMKTWTSRQDNRVRPLHVRLHGRTKPLGSDFWRWPQTGQVLAFPGDARAPLDAIAGCRCFLLLSVR